jgi:orotate phosphoribosyltransferase-like protein
MKRPPAIVPAQLLPKIQLLLEKKLSIKDIAKELTISQEAVTTARRIVIASGKMTDGRTNDTSKLETQALALRQAKNSLSEIAYLMHISKETARQYILAAEAKLKPQATQVLPTHKACSQCPPEKGLQPISAFTIETLKNGSTAVKHCRECTARLKREARHKKNGGAPPPRKIEASDAQLEQIKVLYSDGVIQKDMCDTLKLPPRTVTRAFKKLGLRPKNTKIVFSNDQLAETKRLYNLGYTIADIAKELGVSKSSVDSIYRMLGLCGAEQPKPVVTEKACTSCPEKGLQPLSNFRSRVRKGTLIYESWCRDCAKKHANESGKRRAKRLRKEDPSFKLRMNISWAVWFHLKNNKSSKQGRSCLNFLPSPIEDIRKHIESQWESWMNWGNYGVYDARTWDDNDQSTWTWQIDHIKPHSEFHYTSMDSDEFRACWALSNLRPLAAKDNNRDGVRRIRHAKKAA